MARAAGADLLHRLAWLLDVAAAPRTSFAGFRVELALFTNAAPVGDIPTLVLWNMALHHTVLDHIFYKSTSLISMVATCTGSRFRRREGGRSGHMR